MKIRDFRNKQFYMKDDEYLNGYAKLCGWKATLAYDSLCRHAGRTQEAFPSITLMSKELGVSRNTVIDGIASLIEWNIISSRIGAGRNNLYTLIDKSEWKPKPNQFTTATSSPQQLVHHSNGGSSPHELEVVHHRDTKETHIRKHIKDTISIVNKFVKEIPLEYFKPKTYEENKLLEIATQLGESSMSFLVGVNNKGDFWAIENAWGIFKELDRSKIENPPAYFNKLVEKELLA